MPTTALPVSPEAGSCTPRDAGDQVSWAVSNSLQGTGRGAQACGLAGARGPQVFAQRAWEVAQVPATRQDHVGLPQLSLDSTWELPERAGLLLPLLHLSFREAGQG